MAKRYTDTNKWDKQWFRKLSCRLKCAWDFLCTRCDHAGFWEIDLENAEFFIGEKISLDELKEHFDVELLADGSKLFLPGFIPFQYGKVLKESVNAHRSVIDVLERYNIPSPIPIVRDPRTIAEPFQKGSPGDQDKDKDKDKDQKGGAGGDAAARKKPTRATCELVDDADAGDTSGVFPGCKVHSYNQPSCLLQKQWENAQRAGPGGKREHTNAGGPAP